MRESVEIAKCLRSQAALIRKMDEVAHASGIMQNFRPAAEAMEAAAKYLDTPEPSGVLHAVMQQAEADMKSAHAAICKLQGLDPTTHDWPAWSPQANSRRWFAEIRKQFPLDADKGGTGGNAAKQLGAMK